jgi:hypothetical protein
MAWGWVIELRKRNRSLSRATSSRVETGRFGDGVHPGAPGWGRDRTRFPLTGLRVGVIHRTPILPARVISPPLLCRGLQLLFRTWNTFKSHHFASCSIPVTPYAIPRHCQYSLHPECFPNVRSPQMLILAPTGLAFHILIAPARRVPRVIFEFHSFSLRTPTYHVLQRASEPIMVSIWYIWSWPPDITLRGTLSLSQYDVRYLLNAETSGGHEQRSFLRCGDRVKVKIAISRSSRPLDPIFCGLRVVQRWA